MSVTINDCLINAVGITQTECDCYTDKPENYNTSHSGIYIDELLPLAAFLNLENCEDDGDWTVITKAREEAVKRYMADIKGKLMKEYEAEPKFFKGKIGEAKATTVYNFSKAFGGIILRCRPMKSGYMKINAVGGIFNTTGTKRIYVYNNLGEYVTEFDITTTANIYVNSTLATAITLPLYSEETEITHYYLFYANDANQPLNNYITCQYCGFNSCWSLTDDCYARLIVNNRFHWAKYLQVSGFSFDDISELYEINYGFTNTLFGLTVDVELYCSIDDLFCTGDIEYSANSIAQDQAFAIRYKACEFALRNQLLSDKLTRLNLINRETQVMMLEQWSADYEKLTDNIAKNIDISTTSCLRCRDKWKAQSKLARS